MKPNITENEFNSLIRVADRIVLAAKKLDAWNQDLPKDLLVFNLLAVAENIGMDPEQAIEEAISGWINRNSAIYEIEVRQASTITGDFN